MRNERRVKEPDETYFARRACEENAAAQAATHGLAERCHRELAKCFSLHAATIRQAEEQLGADSWGLAASK